MRKRGILIVDAAINLALGALLLAFPLGVAELLGVPQARPAFYPMVLGGVIFGIGIALVWECLRGRDGMVGLGTGGAIVINFCGAAVLAGWLVFGGLDLPLRGKLFLWCLCALVAGTGAVEIFTSRVK